MKNITRVALLCFSVALAGCISSVSDDEETMYGTFSTSQAEQTRADERIREVVDFKEDINDKATFVSGYSVVNKGTSGTLYLGVYKQGHQSPNINVEERARRLQNSNKKNWTPLSDKSKDGEETIYDASDAFSGVEVGQESPTVSVKVNYDQPDKAYWIYLAIPDEMMEASSSEKNKRMFLERRNSK